MRLLPVWSLDIITNITRRNTFLTAPVFCFQCIPPLPLSQHIPLLCCAFSYLAHMHLPSLANVFLSHFIPHASPSFLQPLLAYLSHTNSPFPFPFFISITSLFPLFLLFFLIYTMYWCFHLSIMSRRACHCKRDHLFSNIVFLCYSTIQYKYHHSTKLYWKMSWICWCQYCYESAARVTMPAATNEWYYFWYSLVLRW